jgi:hypothetical protein
LEESKPLVRAAVHPLMALSVWTEFMVAIVRKEFMVEIVRKAGRRDTRAVYAMGSIARTAGLQP